MKKKKKVAQSARPSLKCTDELIEKMGEYVLAGHWRTTCAVLCGISPTTYYDWMKKGKLDDKEFSQHRKFRRMVLSSEAKFRQKLDNSILDAAQKKAEFENDSKDLMKWAGYRFRKDYAEAKERRLQEQKEEERPFRSVSNEDLLSALRRLIEEKGS